jgi:hypothetical protein
MANDHDAPGTSGARPTNIHAQRAEAVFCAFLGRRAVKFSPHTVCTCRSRPRAGCRTTFPAHWYNNWTFPICINCLYDRLYAGRSCRRLALPHHSGVCISADTHTHIQDLHTGYLSSDSRAHREFALARQFYVKQGQPYYAAAFIRAKDNGSLLREEYFE